MSTQIVAVAAPARARAARGRRRSRFGQSVIIFALLSSVIFASIGLGVDAAVSYFSSGALERAAAAAALAGVPHMPDFAAATTAADAAATKNGMPQPDNTGHNIVVTVSKLPAGCDDVVVICDHNELEVTISESVQTTFLHLVGFRTHTVAQSARAQVLRPLTLGQPGATLGYTESQIQPTFLPGSDYILSQVGFDSSRHRGDAYTPDPNNVNDANSLDQGNHFAPYSSGRFKSDDVHQISQQLGTENTDATLPNRGGQNFIVYVPAGITAEVDVYNASHSPDLGYADNHFSNQPTIPCYNALGEGYLYQSAVGDQPVTDAKDYKCWWLGFTVNGGTDVWGYQPGYSQERYTLYSVANAWDRTLDTKLTQLTVDPMNAKQSWNGQLTNMRTLATITGCNYTTWVDCPIVHGWINVGNYGSGADKTTSSVQRAGSSVASVSGGATGAYYRLRVDRLTYNGSVNPVFGQGDGLKTFSLRVVTAGTSSPCAGCKVSGLGDMTVYTPITNSSFTMPLVSIPPEYAGQNVNVDIWDIGDVNNATSCKVSLLDPSGSLAPVAKVGANWDIVNNGSSRDGTGPGQVSQGYVPAKYQLNPGFAAVQAIDVSVNPDANLFNGRWLHFTVAVPSSYNPGNNPANWYWQMKYQTDGNAFDAFTVVVSNTGSPVHLIP